MQNFEYYTPTRVVFGKGAEQQLAELLAGYKPKKLLLHYGGQSAKKSGLLGRVTASLNAAGLPFVELGGVQPNPRLSLVRKGAEIARAEGVDFILAVGGGSVIDSAKAIGYALACGGDAWDFYTGARKIEGKTPIGVVLTMAAAGSEMSDSSVITNEETGEKFGRSHEIYGRVDFAIMDPALTLTLPAYQTSAGVADILMHTMERYFTAEKDTMAITDGIAEALLRAVMANGRLLCREPENYAARAEVMWAGALSHNGLTGAGAGAGDWACHQLGHELSAKYDLAHGASLSALWGSWARYVYKEDAARFARFAIEVMELPAEGSDEELALAGIEEMEGFFWAIEMPTSIPEAGITATEADLEAMAKGCSRGGKRKVGGMMRLGQEDMLAIYKLANSE